jgi:hypothetical protein
MKSVASREDPSMSSGLEQLLQQHYTGQVVEGGEFTLNRERALEKIADHQLPYPDAWVLKLVQGVVLSGSPALHVNQTGIVTVLEFEVYSEFADGFEKSFFDPAPHALPDVDSLRAGLWTVGLKQRRPFKLTTHQHSFFWNGFEMTEWPDRADPGRCLIEISHRTLEQGKGLPLIREIQAAELNAGLLKVLTSSVFTAPIEIRVDGLRLDGFHKCPENSFSERDLPLKMFWLPGEPELPVPPSNRDNLYSYIGHQKLQVLGQEFSAAPTCSPVSSAALVCAHVYHDSEDYRGWRTTERHSFLFWVKSGVVIQKEKFSFPKGCLSVALFVSAEGLRTDFTGFGLDESESLERKRQVCGDLMALLEAWQPVLSLVDRDWQKKKIMLAGGTALTGLALHFVFPPAFVLTIGGVISAVMSTQGLATVDSVLKKGHKDLLDRLLRSWGSSHPGGSNALLSEGAASTTGNKSDGVLWH